MSAPKRLLVASPREWGHGRTVQRQAERVYLELLLEATRELWPFATILHDGCPTGGSAIIEQVWVGAFGLPSEVYRPEWELCGRGCPAPDGHRKPRAKSDTRHGAAEDFCPDADLRIAARVLHRDSSVRPDRVMAVYGQFSRVTRAIARMAEDSGIPTKRYKPTPQEVLGYAPADQDVAETG